MSARFNGQVGIVTGAGSGIAGTAYTTSKHGLNGLIRSIATIYGSRGMDLMELLQEEQGPTLWICHNQSVAKKRWSF